MPRLNRSATSLQSSCRGQWSLSTRPKLRQSPIAGLKTLPVFSCGHSVSKIIVLSSARRMACFSGAMSTVSPKMTRSLCCRPWSSQTQSTKVSAVVSVSCMMLIDTRYSNNRYHRVRLSTYGTFHRMDRNLPVFLLLCYFIFMRLLLGVCMLAMVLRVRSIAKAKCIDRGCTHGGESMNVLLSCRSPTKTKPTLSCSSNRVSSFIGSGLCKSSLLHPSYSFSTNSGRNWARNTACALKLREPRAFWQVAWKTGMRYFSER